MKRTNKKFSAPTAWGQCGASVRQAAMTLLTIVMAFTAQTAWAGYGWYDASMSIGGITTNPSTWSTSGDTPTDLGTVTDMTITSIAFNVWSDANDRGGANMYFRIWDGGSSQVGADQDLHLGTATRIGGKDHDFAISWTGTLDLAAAVSLTLIPGKTYYIDMWAKTYGSSGDEWISGDNSSNYHAKLTYVPHGNCGTTDHESEVTWSLNSGVLTISGNGAMADYSSSSYSPWYSNRDYITSVVIENGVTTIGNGAFYKCNNLASVSIPASVTSIGEEAFAESGSSTGMAVAIATDPSLEAIGAKAFLFSNLVSITLPDGLKTIGNSAFNSCGKLAAVIIHATSLTTYGNNAFSNAASGLKIYVPVGSGNPYKAGWSTYASIIEEFTASDYCGDPSVNDGKNVVWTLTDGGVLTISGTGAMADYANDSDQPWASKWNVIKTIVINDGVTSIGNRAFSNCEYVTSDVSIPASVTSIGNYSFNYCSMTSLTIPSNSSLETIGSFAFNCSGFGSVTIPASVTSIGNNAFDACTNLTTVTLNSNPSIGESAFKDGATVTMNLTANSAGGANWMTFYNKNYNFQADANTQVFKAALGGTTLTLTELKTDKIVNKDNAVILKSTEGPIVMTLTTTNSSNVFTGNSLKGVDDPAGLTAATPSTTYVLNYKNGIGVGFYKLTSGKTLGVGKAYLIYDDSIPEQGGNQAREFFGFGDTTGINDVRGQKEDVRGEYYDLQGRRVSHPTKGLYIVNGKKVVIK